MTIVILCGMHCTNIIVLINAHAQTISPYYCSLVPSQVRTNSTSPAGHKTSIIGTFGTHNYKTVEKVYLSHLKFKRDNKYIYTINITQLFHFQTLWC